MIKNSSLLHISDEILSSLEIQAPIVALESTVISHGMPYPANVETALGLEALIREQGALPATVAVMDGQIRVGLSQDEIERLARGTETVTKLSRRDLPIVLAQGGLGATTVAATMIAAQLAGIRVFATGGIGGVHRGAPKNFDISADLQELGRTSVAVVCAGAKSILDLPLTLEVLETLGVPVLGYQTDAFPAFYTRDSGLGVDERCDTPKDLARICHLKWELGLEGGVVVANPVPPEYAMDRSLIEPAIEKAVEEADSRGISGKAITPFLLARLVDITQGRSLETNVALIRNNAHLAALLAVELSRLVR